MNHLTSQQIQEYLEKRATNEIELHLGGCRQCRRKADAAGMLERTLRSIPLEKAPPGFTERIVEQLGIRQRASFSWFLFKSLSPILALTIVAAIVFAVFKFTGAWHETELQQTATVTQTVYNQIGGSVNEGLQTFNGWMTKYFSFAFAKNTYGLTTFILIFFGVIALLDKYVLMPMMKKKMM